MQNSNLNLDALLDTRCRSASAGSREHRNEVTLDIRSDLLTEEAIRGLLEDWLIPMIVEDIIQAAIAKPQTP